MIINGIYENQNLLSLWPFSFLFGLRTYQHPCNILNGPVNLNSAAFVPTLKGNKNLTLLNWIEQVVYIKVLAGLMCLRTVYSSLF
jgi:hypothetical protein